VLVNSIKAYKRSLKTLFAMEAAINAQTHKVINSREKEHKSNQIKSNMF